MIDRRTGLFATLLLAWLALVVAGCASSATQASPTPAPVAVTQPEQAVARVLLAEPRLAGISAKNPDLIGQASWYEVMPASGVGAFVVNVRIGWGDCEAGCIDQHQWSYAVSPDGVVTVTSESGAPVPDDAWPSHGAGTRTGIGGVVTAGPTCPVAKDPPDPNCNERPVADAVLVVRDPSGKEVARTTTAKDGTFFIDVPAGGYVVEPQPVTGLMGTAQPQSVTVNDNVTSRLEVSYDTGIR
jgi:hypothetical protein